MITAPSDRIASATTGDFTITAVHTVKKPVQKKSNKDRVTRICPNCFLAIAPAVSACENCH